MNLSPLQSLSVDTTLVMTWRGGGETAGGLQEEQRVLIRFRDVEISRLKVFVLNEAAQFVIWQL